MSPSAKLKTVVTPDAGQDYGPAVIRDRDGRSRHWGGAASIVVETRDDPTVIDRVRPVRGARRRNALFDLRSRNCITKRQHEAVEYLLDDLSLASGASQRDPFEASVSGSGRRSGLPERQTLAFTRVKAAILAVGLNRDTPFWWVVFHNRSLTDYERVHNLRNGTAIEMLRLSLDGLDDYYLEWRLESA